MKKILISLIAVLSLSGCLGIGDDGEISTLQTKVYIDKAEGFKIEIDSSLITLKEDELPSGVLAGFLDVLNRQDSFTPNLHITKEEVLYDDISSALYMESFIRKTANTIPGYVEERTMTTKVAGEDTQIHIFKIEEKNEGEEDQESNKQTFKFIQTAVINSENNYVYILTATLNADASKKQDNLFIEAMNGFSFKIID